MAPIKTRLPRNLGPRVKRELLTAPADSTLICAAELSPKVSGEQLEAKMVEFGGKVRSHSADARLITIEIPAARLRDLAAMQGVVYVELAQTYTP
ncbi:MAG: hypothetical protein QNJ67_07690 [Kiloniellales bacterium]|nr:hypothetical protein [Kiloniellales bacterium]